MYYKSWRIYQPALTIYDDSVAINDRWFGRFSHLGTGSHPEYWLTPRVLAHTQSTGSCKVGVIMYYKSWRMYQPALTSHDDAVAINDRWFGSFSHLGSGSHTESVLLKSPMDSVRSLHLFFLSPTSNNKQNLLTYCSRHIPDS